MKKRKTRVKSIINQKLFWWDQQNWHTKQQKIRHKLQKGGVKWGTSVMYIQK